MVCVHQQMRADKQAQARRVKASNKAMYLLQKHAPPPCREVGTVPNQTEAQQFLGVCFSPGMLSGEMNHFNSYPAHLETGVELERAGRQNRSPGQFGHLSFLEHTIAFLYKLRF